MTRIDNGAMLPRSSESPTDDQRSPGIINIAQPPSRPPLLQDLPQERPKPTVPAIPPHRASDPTIEDLYDKAVKEARRQGVIGPSPTKEPSNRIPTIGSAQPAAPSLAAFDSAMLKGALAGTDKFRKMSKPERDHIFKMLEANDLPGLQAVASAGNPLRSFSTGLKVGKQLLDKRGADNLPPILRNPLTQLKKFYERNPQLVELGDARAFSDERARTSEEVKQLRKAFTEAYRLLRALRRALPSDGTCDEA